jgi:uncharacterized delta-60 repeat protein
MSIKKKILMGAAGTNNGGPFWISQIGGTDTEDCQSVAVDSADNVISVGYTTRDGVISAPCLLVVKQDAAGDVLWQRSYQTGTFGLGVAIDSADNIIVAGYTKTSSQGDDDLLVMKINSSGTRLWNKTLGDTRKNRGYGVAVDSSDNIYVCGNSYTSTDAASSDSLLVKYNSSGTLIWYRTIGASGNDHFYGVTVDSVGDIITFGETGVGSPPSSAIVIKYNSSGTVVWKRSIGGASNEKGYAGAVDLSDNIYVCGMALSVGPGSTDCLIAKYSSSGTLSWQRALGSSGQETGFGLTVDLEDNLIVCSESHTGDFIVAKYNTSGTLIWDNFLGDSSNIDNPRSVVVDSLNNIIVGGISSRYNPNIGELQEMLIAKLPSDGSGYGTYGPYTYYDASLTSQSISITGTDPGVSPTTQSLTVGDPTFAERSVSLTVLFYPI